MFDKLLTSHIFSEFCVCRNHFGSRPTAGGAMAGPGLLSLQPSGPLSLASQGPAQGPSAGAGNVNFSGSLLDPANAPKASVDPQATGAALGSVQMGGPKQDAMAQQGDKGRTATAAAEAAAALSGLSGFLIAASGEVELS